MSERMTEETEKYLKDLQTFMLECTNMTDGEAWEFAFRCWQLKNNRKFKSLIFGEV